MYSEEFENLLKEYLTDGIITTKERQVLLKKAQQLGYDVDEVDLYIDAQQQKCDQAVEAAAAKKRGKVCPRCGASVQSMQLTCPECGFEFNKKEAVSSAQKLMEKLEELDNKKTGSIFKATLENKTPSHLKAQAISAFPIPNSKEDLIEFASLCLGNTDDSFLGGSDLIINDAWKSKSKQVAAKIRYMMKNDADAMALAEELDKKSKGFFAKLFGLFRR